jgi:NAD+ synthase (glutamine-hydrolysing)
MLVDHIKLGNTQVLNDVRRVAKYGPTETPTDAKDLAKRIFFTCYMGTKNSSEETRSRAAALAAQIGATHLDVNIDAVVASFEGIVSTTLKKQPKFKVHGGTSTENLALQNVQARTRMVLANFLAQLGLWSQNKEYALPSCSHAHRMFLNLTRLLPARAEAVSSFSAPPMSMRHFVVI